MSLKTAAGILLMYLAISALSPLQRAVSKADDPLLALSYVCVKSLSHSFAPPKPLSEILYSIGVLVIALVPPVGA